MRQMEGTARGRVATPSSPSKERCLHIKEEARYRSPSGEGSVLVGMIVKVSVLHVSVCRHLGVLWLGS